MYFIEADKGSDDDEMNLETLGENEDSALDKRLVCSGNHHFSISFIYEFIIWAQRSTSGTVQIHQVE